MKKGTVLVLRFLARLAGQNHSDNAACEEPDGPDDHHDQALLVYERSSIDQDSEEIAQDPAEQATQKEPGELGQKPQKQQGAFLHSMAHCCAS